MGQPIGGHIDRDEMVTTYGENKVLQDYWFMLNLQRSTLVNEFFHRMSRIVNFRLYGVLDLEAIERKGLEPIREGRAAVEAEPGKTVSRATVAKLDHNHLSFSSVDFSMIAPMDEESELMNNSQRIYLAHKIPPKLECHKWILAFSTSKNGFSLRNMIMKISSYVQGGALLLVMSDTDNNVFGAFLNSIPKINDRFEGTGETFLFKLRPETKTFNWTGENNFFYRVNNEELIVGSSKGKFGLWIDRDLYKCRSQACATFDNEPLAGNSKEDFTLKTLEAWVFDMA